MYGQGSTAPFNWCHLTYLLSCSFTVNYFRCAILMYVYLFLKCGIFLLIIRKKNCSCPRLLIQRYALNKVLCCCINNNGFTKYLLRYIFMTMNVSLKLLNLQSMVRIFWNTSNLKEGVDISSNRFQMVPTLYRRPSIIVSST